MHYDIIGDIHGHAQKLITLLIKLGYNEIDGVWQHSTRQAIFVGDFIDRGPDQLQTLQIVRKMIEAGFAKAVMGNHEFNAIAYFTPDPHNEGAFLRPHNLKNKKQHGAFLDSVIENSVTHQYWVDWFRTLPLWLDLPEISVIHACWKVDLMEALKPHLNSNNTLTPKLVESASREGHPHFIALEGLIKGIEVKLPDGVSFQDKEGHERRKTRVKWWDESARTYRRAALLEGMDGQHIPESPIPEWAVVPHDFEKPVFFGHYWFTGELNVLTHKLCCVDYSAARGEMPLVAYRFDGETVLDSSKLIC